MKKRSYSDYIKEDYSKEANEYARKAVHRYKTTLHKLRAIKCKDVRQGTEFFDCGREEGTFCLYETCPMIRG